MQVTTIGLDLAKNVFQVHGIDEHGEVAFNRALMVISFRRAAWHALCLVLHTDYPAQAKTCQWYFRTGLPLKTRQNTLAKPRHRV